MDNQQERFSEGFNMGWLTCGIESEGHITLAWGRASEKTFQIIPRVAIANMKEKYVQKAQEISQKLGIGCYIEFDSGNGKRTPMYRISWQGFKRVKSLLEHISQYLIIKSEQVRLVKEFIDSRISVKSGSPYRKEDVDKFLAVRKLNGTKNELPKHISEKILRDYTLNTIKSDDIVHPTSNVVG